MEIYSIIIKLENDNVLEINDAISHKWQDVIGMFSVKSTRSSFMIPINRIMTIEVENHMETHKQ